MTAYPSSSPVVIVGAGPTGLTTACLLATYGVEFIMLDREPGPIDLPRAIVLDDEGARTLQAFGMGETYLADPMEGEGSRYFDDAGESFAVTGRGPRNFGFAKRQFIYQPELETALRDRLEALAPGRLRYSSEVIDVEQGAHGATTVLRGPDGALHRIESQWVLACDGGRSPIRERLGIAMSGNTYQEDWIVLDTLNDPDDTLYSKFFCSSTRPAVSVPAPNGGRRYEFMLLPGESREAVLEDTFLTEICAPYRRYDPADVLRKTVYTFHARMAERFQAGRILLMGDAAHLTPPFAGQGMNAGLRDAHNVAWKVAAMLKGGAAPALLETYDAERRGPAWDMIQLAVAMGNIVMPAGRDQIVFRDLLMKALEPFPKVRDYLIHMRFKPQPRYDRGVFLDLDRPEFDASLVGRMVPQPEVLDGERRMRLDAAAGPGFTLLAQDAAGAKALAGLTRDSLLGLPMSRVALDTSGRGKADMLRSADDETARPFRTHRDQILLIRPDRYCAAAFGPEALDASLARFTALAAKAAPALAPDEVTA